MYVLLLKFLNQKIGQKILMVVMLKSVAFNDIDTVNEILQFD